MLKNQKAEYGKSVIKKLSKKLIIEYGRGYGERNIFRMLKFYDYFPDFEILSTLSAKLSWSHFVELLQIQDTLKRDFYATMCTNLGELERFILEMGNDFAFLATQKGITIDGEENLIEEVHCMTYEEVNTINKSNNLRLTGAYYCLATANDGRYYLWYVGKDGTVQHGGGGVGIRPVITLTSGVKIKSGTGNEEDPYILGK